MDINLFSDILKELILDNDEVALPGLGTFVSEIVPSTFSDKGYTINPPYRKLSFRQRKGDDSTLVGFYSKINGTDEEMSRRILTEFSDGLRKTLQSKKTVLFPGLGKLRATRENAFFFIPDEELEIYPYGFGLEPVSLKTHEETPEEVSAVVADLKSIIDPEPVQEPVSETPATPPAVPEPVDSAEPAVSEVAEEKEPADAASPEKKKRKNIPAWLIVVLAVAAAVILFFAAFFILCRVAPDFIDSILYTPEQLRIINYEL